MTSYIKTITQDKETWPPNLVVCIFYHKGTVGSLGQRQGDGIHFLGPDFAKTKSTFTLEGWSWLPLRGLDRIFTGETLMVDAGLIVRMIAAMDQYEEDDLAYELEVFLRDKDNG